MNERRMKEKNLLYTMSPPGRLASTPRLSHAASLPRQPAIPLGKASSLPWHQAARG